MEYTLENYRKEVEALKKEFELRKNQLIRIYADENNPYKIGDIISDNVGAIIIDKISYTETWIEKKPCCIYSGFGITKKGELRKDKARKYVYQDSIGLT